MVVVHAVQKLKFRLLKYIEKHTRGYAKQQALRLYIELCLPSTLHFIKTNGEHFIFDMVQVGIGMIVDSLYDKVWTRNRIRPEMYKKVAKPLPETKISWGLAENSLKEYFS